MGKSIGLGVFGTFGNPNGYQQSFFLNAHFPQNLDLNPNAIELVPNSELYVVRKDYNKGVHSICVCIYTFAKEFQSSRRGTFIGNCVVFNDCFAEGEYIYECLKEIHTDTVSNPKNMVNNMLQVQQVSDLEVKEPLSFSPLSANTKKIAYRPQLPDNSKSYFIAANDMTGVDLEKAVKLFFNKSFSDFPQVGVMYFSSNPHVIQYAKAKGLIQVADWNEFKNYTNEPPPQPQTKKQSQKKGGGNVSTHQPQPNIQEQNSERFKPYEPIFKIWNTPQYPWDMDEINRRVIEHNMIIKQYEMLEDELYKLKASIEEEGLMEKFAFFLNRYKIPIILFIVFLLGLFVAYVFLFSEPEVKNAVIVKPTTELPVTQPVIIAPKLTPEPNTALTEKEINILSGNNIKGKTIEEVIQLIYKLNPSDIGQHYSGQEQLYAKRLVESNSDCFKPYNNFTVCFCKELRNIPAFKTK